MDVQQLLEPLKRTPVPDVEHVHTRVASRRRRRRAVLAVGFGAVVTVLAAAVWLTPRDKASVATVGHPTADPASQVRRVAETLLLQGPSLDDKLAQIDDPSGLDAVIAQGMQDDRAHRLTLTVTRVDINDSSAFAHIDFFLDGAPAYTDGLLEMINNNGRWLARHDSYCALIATGGVHCPTPTNANTFDPSTPSTVVSG
jgi:hypothetical protein